MPPVDPAQTADMSQLAEEVNNNTDSAMAEAAPNPEEHGTTGPEADDPGKAQGVVPGQEEREAAASQTTEESETPATEEEEPAEEQFEEFEISKAEDSVLSDEQFDFLMDIVEKSGMNEEQAKDFISKQESLYKQGAQEVLSARTAEAEKNKADLIADPLFEGDFAGALKIMAPTVADFGDDGFNELLRSEIGNHPALGRFIYRIAKARESDSFHGKGGQPRTEVKNPLKNLYPEFFEKA